MHDAVSTRTIWDIATDFQDFEALVSNLDDDISEEDAAKLQAFYDELETEKEKKLDNYGRFCRNLETGGNACLEEAERLKKLGESKLQKAEMLKSRLLQVFKFKEWKEYSTSFFTFKRKGSGGAPPVILTKEYEEDPSLLPEQFRRDKPELVPAGIKTILDGDNEPAKKAVAYLATLGAIRFKPEPNKDAIKSVLAGSDEDAKKAIEDIAKFGDKKETLSIS